MRHETNSRHAFVIGPPCKSSLLSRKGRHYYCRSCNWAFLVSGSQVVVPDEEVGP